VPANSSAIVPNGVAAPRADDVRLVDALGNP